MKKLTEQPETILINNKVVTILTYFNNFIVLDLQTLHEKVFKHFNLTINTYYDENLNVQKFMDYALNNFNSNIYIFFELDCIPLDGRIIKNLVTELSNDDCIIGIEQSANHLNPNFIYAGPACFGITKNVFNKLGKLSFEGTFRSDVAQAYENNISVKFIELISSKNNKWKLGSDRFFGNGCIYKFKDSKIYHQFQSHQEEQKIDFKVECEKIINQNKIIIVLSTAIINDNINVEHRLKEYEECFNILKNLGYDDFYIVETALTKSYFLEKYSKNVIYTNANGVYNNRGTNYVNAFKKFLNESSFNDDDIIIHITGRYPLINDSFFKNCLELESNKIGCFRKDDYNQFHLFLYGMRFKFLKDLLNSIDVDYMERYMINLEAIFSNLINHQQIKFVDKLGIIGRQSNEKDPSIYGQLKF